MVTSGINAFKVPREHAVNRESPSMRKAKTDARESNVSFSRKRRFRALKQSPVAIVSSV
jgi:hypothetical protein